MKYRKATAGRRPAKLLTVIMLVMATAVLAQAVTNLIKNGDAESGTLAHWSGFNKVASEAPHAGEFCFSSTSNRQIMAAEFLPIDPDKTTTLTGWFKSAGATKSKLYFGYAPYDAEKKLIESRHVNCVPGTETTLAEACAKDDLVVKIAAGDKWVLSPNACVAFAVDDSGEYADLPNRKITNAGITKVENKGGHWEVHLKSKCGQDYPTGTKIREQVAITGFAYTAASSVFVPQEWTQYSGIINSMSKNASPKNQWWPGTRYVKIIILANYGQKNDAELHVDDMSLIVSDK